MPDNDKLDLTCYNQVTNKFEFPSGGERDWISEDAEDLLFVRVIILEKALDFKAWERLADV